MYNILEAVDFARAKNSFSNGLDYVRQTNCQCTLSNGLFRIYRTPNIDGTTNKTTWGVSIQK